MTRLAAAIRPGINAEQRDLFTIDGHRAFVKRLAQAFAVDNPNFRREQFERAAGITD